MKTPRNITYPFDSFFLKHLTLLKHTTIDEKITVNKTSKINNLIVEKGESHYFSKGRICLQVVFMEEQSDKDWRGIDKREVNIYRKSIIKSLLNNHQRHNKTLGNHSKEIVRRVKFCWAIFGKLSYLQKYPKFHMPETPSLTPTVYELLFMESKRWPDSENCQYTEGYGTTKIGCFLEL